jgi:hypothetical protein
VLVGGQDLQAGPIVLLWRDGEDRHVRVAFDDHAQVREAFDQQAARLGVASHLRRDALADVVVLARPAAVLLVRGARGRYAALARALQPADLTEPAAAIALEVDRELRLPILAASVDAARAIAGAIGAARQAPLPWQLFVPAPR